MYLRKLKSLVLKIVAGAILFVIALVLVVAFVNRKDEPPSEAVIQLQHIVERSPPVADRDNAYVYVMGFSAPDNENAGKAGTAYVEWLRKIVATSGTSTFPEYPTEKRVSIGARDAQFKQFANLCKQGNRVCAEAMERDPAQLQAWTQRHANLIDRYDSLLEFKQWRELWPSDPRTRVAPFSDVLEGQRLMLVKAWLLAGRGDDSSCKRLLERDLRFWRMTLDESSSVISKVIAASALERHFTMGNLVLRRFSNAQAMKAMPDGWREPISARERSMARVMANEWEFADRSIGSMAEQRKREPAYGDSVGRLLFQPQATSNANAERMLALVRLFASDFADIPGASKTLLSSKALAQKGFTEMGIYNPVGEVLLNVNNMKDLSKYGFRIANLEGIRRVSLLAAQLRSSGVKVEGVAERLEGSELRPPFDGNAFGWDAAERTLVYRQALAERADFRLTY